MSDSPSNAPAAALAVQAASVDPTMSTGDAPDEVAAILNPFASAPATFFPSSSDRNNGGSAFTSSNLFTSSASSSAAFTSNTASWKFEVPTVSLPSAPFTVVRAIDGEEMTLPAIVNPFAAPRTAEGDGVGRTAITSASASKDGKSPTSDAPPAAALCGTTTNDPSLFTSSSEARRALAAVHKARALAEAKTKTHRKGEPPATRAEVIRSEAAPAAPCGFSMPLHEDSALTPGVINILPFETASRPVRQRFIPPEKRSHDFSRLLAGSIMLKVANDYLTDIDAACLAQCSDECVSILKPYRIKRSIPLRDILWKKWPPGLFDFSTSADRRFMVGRLSNVHVDFAYSESTVDKGLRDLLFSTPARIVTIFSELLWLLPDLSDSDVASPLVRSITELDWRQFRPTWSPTGAAQSQLVPDLSAFVHLTHLQLPSQITIDLVRTLLLPPNLQHLVCGQFLLQTMELESQLKAIPLITILPSLPSSLRRLMLPAVAVAGLPSLPEGLTSFTVTYLVRKTEEVDFQWLSVLPATLTELRVSRSMAHPDHVISFDRITRWPSGLQKIEIHGVQVHMHEWTPPASLTRLHVSPTPDASRVRWPSTCKRLEFASVPHKFSFAQLVIPEGVEEVILEEADEEEVDDATRIEGVRLASSVQSVMCTPGALVAEMRKVIIFPDRSSLTSLDLGDWDTSFAGMEWPPSLTQLKVGLLFKIQAPTEEQPDGCFFPPVLRSLDLSECTYIDLAHLRLPADLEELHCPKPMQSTTVLTKEQSFPVVWPSRLRVLYLPAVFKPNPYVDCAFHLPASLRELHVGEGWNKPLHSLEALPPGLVSLYTESDVKPFPLWPASLRILHLRLNRATLSDILERLPLQLEEFALRNSRDGMPFTPDRSCALPAMLKRLTLQNAVDWLEEEKLPPHLEKLQLPRGFMLGMLAHKWRQMRMPVRCSVEFVHM